MTANPRRVCLFIPQLGFGGAELQLALLATRLPGAGFAPIVATVRDHHGVAEILGRSGIETVFLPRRLPGGVDTIIALRRLLIERRIQLLHAWLWAANWRAAVAALGRPEVRVIASIRSMEDDLGRHNLLAWRAISHRFSAIIVNSRAVLRRSADRTGVSDAKYRIVHNAVDLDRFAADDEADASDGPVAGYVGTLHVRKRVATLPSIASRVTRALPDARFLVVGDGPDREALLDAMLRQGMSDRFELVGRQERVAPFVRRMRVLVHPSMNEGCSNVILEGMALGVPTVAYAVGGNPEIVEEGRTGYLVPDGREDLLADRVAELLADPEKARRFGRAARERISKDFSVEAMVRATIAIYEEAAS